MNLKTQKMLLGFVLALVALVIVLIASSFFTYKFSYTTPENVPVVSNYYEPKPYLGELSERKTFVVSPQMYESSSVNSFMGGGMNLFIVVLTGNDKNAITLVRVLDAENNLAYCKTNWADSKTEETISKKVCLDFLDSTKAVTVLIDVPNSAKSSAVVLGMREIGISPQRTSDVAAMSFSVLKEMFPNAQDIVEKANIIVGSAR